MMLGHCSMRPGRPFLAGSTNAGCPRTDEYAVFARNVEDCIGRTELPPPVEADIDRSGDFRRLRNKDDFGSKGGRSCRPLAGGKSAGGGSHCHAIPTVPGRRPIPGIAHKATYCMR